MILRALASAVLAISIASAVGAALAQERDTSAAPESHAPPLLAGDPTSARIEYLHDRLRITAEQEELWERLHKRSATMQETSRRSSKNGFARR